MISSSDIRDWRNGKRPEYVAVQLFTGTGQELLMFSDGEVQERRNSCIDWCVNNLPGYPGNEDWRIDGVTRYSYRIIFANKIDACAFMLATGLTKVWQHDVVNGGNWILK